MYRQRRRSVVELRKVSISWEFNDDDYMLFQSFFYYKLNGGNDWFEISLPMGGGFRTCIVRFFEATYKTSAAQVLFWNVSATIEIQELPPISEANFDTMVSVGGIDIVEGLANHFHEIIHNNF